MVVFALFRIPVLAQVEDLAFDGFLQLRGPRPVAAPVVVAAIDSEAVDRYGRWPWPRTLLAELTRRLDDAGAAAIVFDVVFAEPSGPWPGFELTAEDRELAAAFRAADRVVLAYFFDDPNRPREPGLAPPWAGSADNVRATAVTTVGRAAELPLPRYLGVEPNLDLFAAAVRSQGFGSNERRSGVARRYRLIAAHDGEVYPSLPLAAVRLARDLPVEVARGARGLPVVRLGGRSVPTDARGRIPIDFPGAAGSLPTVGIARILDGRAPADAFRDALVFVGATETGVGDVTATPFGNEVPGVEVHAAVAENLLAGRILRDGGVQLFVSALATLGLGILVAFLVAVAGRPLTGSLAAMAAVFAWPALAYLAFRQLGWHLQVVAPVAAGGVALVVALRHQVGAILGQVRKLRQYVSAPVAEEVFRNPRLAGLGGERREMSVLFLDIRGFTTLSEGLEPDQVVALLNRFFTPMTRVVFAAGGTLDKYMGDALMAFFGAPVRQADHAERACRAALAMSAELDRLNRAWRDEGLLAGEDAIGVGIGINSGEMSVGNMGSEDIFDYTVIGDAVNLGARVEGLNKLYGTQILATGTTVRAAGAGFLFRELDRVRVKGKTAPVAIHELLAAHPAPQGARERADRFREALAAYRGRRFGEAAALARALADDLGDPPAVHLAERAGTLARRPPDEAWEPVESLTTK